MSKQMKIIVGILAAILVLGGILVWKSDDSPADNPSTEELSENETRVTGEIICLPMRSGTPDEKSCVKAISGDDEKVYALNTMDIGRPEDKLEIGDRVTAIGVSEPADLGNEESSFFIYDAVLVPRTLTSNK